MAVSYQSISVRFADATCFVNLVGAESKGVITPRLVTELLEVLDRCERSASIIVLSGSPEVFCNGADFGQLSQPTALCDTAGDTGPERLYEVWARLAGGPYVTIAQVRGKANAGGIGFVAACDIVLAEDTAVFSLSELLFGLFPACVLPFLWRRVGFQRAHYMTLTTQVVPAAQAQQWGLVDATAANSDLLVQRHLSRLRPLTKAAVHRYKTYAMRLRGDLQECRAAAIAANHEVFNDPENLRGIRKYVEHGVFPWEGRQ